MKYLDKQDLFFISKAIQKNLSHREPSPNYIFETSGREQWLGVTERIKMKYYPDFFDKATKLLVDIIKDHFYSNGNKRLALVTTIFFIDYNQFKIRRYSKKKYKDYLKNLFPQFKSFKNYSDFSSAEFAFYNLSIIIAESSKHNLSHDELKERTRKFLTFALYETS